MSSDLVLITGATGYIASWIVHYCLEQGYRVRATVRDPSNEKKLAHLKALPGASERLEFVKLDLSKSPKEDFDAMVQDVTYVLHTASPFPDRNPKDENELIEPAVRGTTSVLEACKDSTSVKQIVITSSTVAMGEGCMGPGLFTKKEQDWTDLAKAGAYPKSKTLAEKAAWEFHDTHAPKWSLCTINPGFVLGPSLTSEVTTSSGFPARLLKGEFPMAVKFSVPIVDVRDVAKAHVQALGKSKEQVHGRRFALVNETHWMLDMANMLREEFEQLGYKKLPTLNAPNFVVGILSFFDAQMASLTLDSISVYDNYPSRSVLGLEYIDMKKTLKDAGHSALFHGLVDKTPEYAPPTPDWTPLSS